MSAAPSPTQAHAPRTAPRGDARVGVIDSFRGVAILSVLMFHFTVALTPPLFPSDSYGYAHAFPMWLEAGRYGVHLFFVISGLVIAQTLVKSKSALQFFWKRFARLYPAYIVALLLAYGLVAVLGPPFGPASPLDLVANATMAARDLGRPWIDPVYWSLLVELKFYLVAGISYALLKNRFWIGVVAYAVGVAAIAHFRPWGAHIWLISDYMPYFLAGMAAQLFCFERRRTAAAVCLAAAAGLYGYYAMAFARTCAYQGVCLHSAPDGLANAYLLFGVGAFLLLLAGGVRAGFAPLSFVGRTSYSLYLVHSFVGLLAIRALKAMGAPDAVTLGVAVAAALGLAWLMFRYVEEPGHRYLLNLRKRLLARWATPPSYPIPATAMRAEPIGASNGQAYASQSATPSPTSIGRILGADVLRPSSLREEP